MEYYPHLKMTVLAIAVMSMLASTSVWADDEAAALKSPTSTLEVGVIRTNTGSNTVNSTKFGEYNGLNDTGSKVFLNAIVRGGSAYSENENGELGRWSIKANEVGLSNGNFSADIGEQGGWSIGFEYDQLRHSLSDGYQTPYSLSGNTYTLPSGFALISDTTSPGTDAHFQTVDLASTRRNTAVNGVFQVDSHISLNFDYKHLEQTGGKLMGFGIAGVNSAKGEAVAILPMPTQSTTDTLTLGGGWTDGRTYLNASYLGSFYNDNYDRVNFTSYSGARDNQWMTTPPDNRFNQFNISAGHQFTKRTKLTGNISYGVNVQDVDFVKPEDGLMLIMPPEVSSLNGKIINTHADLKISDQTTSNLTLSGSIRYDERDNKTESYLYNFNAISGKNPAYYPNTPLSTRKTQTELSSDYRINSNHAVRIGYTHENLNRWCSSYAVSSNIAVGQLGYYPEGTNCVVAKESSDDRVETTYRVKVSDTVGFRLSYGYSDRNTTNDPTAITAMSSSKKGVMPIGTPLTTTPFGLNAGDFYGFYPFFNASRTQHSLRSSVNWDVTESLSVNLGGKITDDDYNSIYGVQGGSSNSINLDVNYSINEASSLYGWVTQQQRKRDMKNVQSVSGSIINTWTNDLKDSDSTLGFGFKQDGLLGGKLQLLGDWTYASGKSSYSTLLNYTVTPGCETSGVLSCGQLPDIKSTLNQFKLTGIYQVNKDTKLVMYALHQRLRSSDYYYNGLAYSYTPTTLLPTNQSAPNYTINAVMASLVISY